MDSTHKTNKHDWKLYTMLVQDVFGSWLAGSHFFINTEEQGIVTKRLQVLKQWAMYKITHISYEQLVQEAIASLPFNSKKTYVQYYWFKNIVKWVMWSRQHSPLLLQITSTSPVESYHVVLKKRGNASFGLLRACKVIRSVDESYINCASQVRFEFKTRCLIEVVTYSFLAGFPYPVQLLLVDEIQAFDKHIEDGKAMPDHDTLKYSCQFFCKYLLLCQHLFHCNIHGDFITDKHWEAFQNTFSKSGFNVYVSQM
ncbi:hypothetical protein BC936DRAFT_142698 [Jimgerdemannia flammicorona]|uniref:Uncharacterized protein n=1 Tax=Jimgerdemannia flammicorona TaxID=994334 RepID=A0A433DMX0_9FUNG|nr:hypothetical protein BC936DRAFT_142698 [Jimgerdemannia flammicorona]